MARYLIEDNYEDFHELNFEKTSQLIMIRTYFKKLIGKYKLLEPDSDHQMMNEIAYVMQNSYIYIQFFLIYLISLIIHITPDFM